MNKKTLIFSILCMSLIAACGPSVEELAGTYAAGTQSAQQTGTAAVQDAVNAILTATAEAATDTPVSTDTPAATDTPVDSPTPEATNTLAATFTPTVQTEAGPGETKIVITNNTGFGATISFSGPESYSFFLGQGRNIYFMKAGRYNFTLTFCEGEVVMGEAIMNATWQYFIKCP